MITVGWGLKEREESRTILGSISDELGDWPAEPQQRQRESRRAEATVRPIGDVQSVTRSACKTTQV